MVRFVRVKQRHLLESLFLTSILLAGCGGGGGSFSGSTPTSSTSSASPSPSPSSSAPAPSSAVAYVNTLRAVGGLPPVTENTALAQGLAAHALYMVKNDFIGHSEDPGRPFFSPEGDVAARNSNVAVSTNVGMTEEDAINGWIAGPFHAAGILDTKLRSTMFSAYAETKSGVRYGACLDVLRGLGEAAAVNFPVLWPGNGSTVGLTSYEGNESPDPLTGTPGYVAPTGLPIYCLIGPGGNTPVVTGSSLTVGGVPVAHAVFDETTYSNPDAETQALGRNVLDSRDMVVIVPQAPLVRGQTYAVSLSVSGQTIQWSFSVSPNAR